MGGDLHIISASLPSTPRKVLSGHGTKSSILYLHSPGVRPKVIVRPSGHPLIQDSLKDHGSFLGPGWGEETLEAELFQESQESLVDRAEGSDYRVPLIPQEQAYANHGSQEVQVAAADGCPNPAASNPSGGGHRGLQEGGRDPASPTRCSEQGVLRR